MQGNAAVLWDLGNECNVWSFGRVKLIRRGEAAGEAKEWRMKTHHVSVFYYLMKYKVKKEY